MTDEEAALLAELKAISNNSASASRFDNDDDEEDNTNNNHVNRQKKNNNNNNNKAKKVIEVKRTSTPKPSTPKPSTPKTKVISVKKNSPTKNKENNDNENLPPWKRKGRKSTPSKSRSDTDPLDNVEIMVKPSPRVNGQQSPRVESAQSISQSSAKSTPNQHVNTNNISHEEERKDDSQSLGGFTRSSDPKTFQGEFGGSAEDAELLAELRAISMKSSSSGRFADSEEIESSNIKPKEKVPVSKTRNNTNSGEVPPWKRSSRKSTPQKEKVEQDKEQSLPPWKRKISNSDPLDSDEVMASPKPETTIIENIPSENDPIDNNMNTATVTNSSSSSSPKTYEGERGGSAEDAELLAALKAISMNSSSNRFDDVALTRPKTQQTKTSKKGSSVKKNSPSLQGKNNQNDESLPPWKRNNKRNSIGEDANSFGNVNSTVSSNDEKMDGTSTQSTGTPNFGGFPANNSYKGERGGSAEDAALLAELRAISLQSTSNRFDNDDESRDNAKIEKKVSMPKHSDQKSVMPQSKGAPKPFASTGAKPTKSTVAQNNEFSVHPGVDEIIVTVENVRDELVSKNWKYRKASYELLAQLIENCANGKEAANDINSDDVYQSLDNMIPDMMKETNAGALDSALRLALLYSDHCNGATTTSQAKRLSEFLTSGSALAATRPSTTKLVKSLYLKIMEVGSEGTGSIHAVIESLLTIGLKSKKPKVVVNSIQLVLDSAYAFGASSLPLGKIISSASIMLEHSNRDVREIGIQILAEICRSVGSREPLEDTISIMRASQVAELDKLLSDQTQPTVQTVGLRHTKMATSSNDALAVMQAGVEEAAIEAFNSREAVDIFKQLKETEFYIKIKEKKWSEKTAALDILLACGGKKPYKIAQPSTNAHYVELISDLKRLLEHTHFAVKSKAMLSLAMLAEGIGEKLFPYLRPLLLPIIQLSKDKKLTGPTNECLDALFGNILSFDHLMEKDDGLPAVLDERIEKNAIVRQTSLTYLKRCIARSDKAGPRGYLKPESAVGIAKFCVSKANDSSASVRNEVALILKALIDNEDNTISRSMQRITNELESSNPRLCKMLKKGNNVAVPKVDVSMKKVNSKRSNSREISRPPSTLLKTTSPKRSMMNSKSSSVTRVPQQGAPISSGPIIPKDEDIVSLEEALIYLSSLGIPGWSSAEDDGGIELGLKSTNWKFRKDAIDALAEYSHSDVALSNADKYTENVLVVVKSFTKEFKDSNFNILKAIIELFLAICNLLKTRDKSLGAWISRRATTIAVEKIADKKFEKLAPVLLTRLCEMQLPDIIIALAIDTIETIKSPLQHEGLLSWMVVFCKEFGASAIGQSLPICIDWLLKECSSPNVKVRNASLHFVGEIHSQLGPMVRALILANTTVEQSVKDQVINKIESCPMDPKAASVVRERSCNIPGQKEKDSNSLGNQLSIHIPKTDIVACLPSDCITRMGLTDSKDSWKKRKEALEEVESICAQYKGLISTDPSCFDSLVKLVRALKMRLGDSQSNLKPLAARNISEILGSVDGFAQAKLGKIVYGPLVSAAMNDNKKIMRDASLEAIRSGTMKLDIEGGGVNHYSMDSFMNSCAMELLESQKAIGLPDVLSVILERVKFFPKVEQGNKSKGRNNEDSFSKAIVNCLLSSQSESRAIAEEIMRESIMNRVITVSSAEKATSKLLNAEQRKIRTILDKLGSIQFQDDQSPKRSTGRQGSTQMKSTVPMERIRKASRTPVIQQRSISRGRRESTNGSKQVSDQSTILFDLLNDPAFHPLQSETFTSVSKSYRISKQRDHIPEYPDEPSGQNTFNELKKAWQPLLPSESIKILFPSSGIRVQDDASDGCELLSRGVELTSESGNEVLLTNQLDLVIRWFALSLCSRETTKGMQSLMSFLVKLTTLLRDKNYELTDGESFMLLPHLLEKAGSAKGRFKEMIPELINSMVNDALYPIDKYGSVICVAVIENTTTPKTRGLAIRQCQFCVEKVGLNAIGKKGILAVAKSFSDETLLENKSAFLDLIEIIIMKMNGDVKKFMKLCGAAHLSSRGREAIENRMSKKSFSSMQSHNQSSLASRSSFVPTENAKHSEDIEGPFKFSFNSSNKGQSPEPALTGGASSFLQHREKQHEVNSGAAASLRERLKQIRDRHQSENDHISNQLLTSSQNSMVNDHDLTPPNSDTYLRSIMKDVDELLFQNIPLGKNTDKSSTALIGLRKIHASLTNGSTDNTLTDPLVLSQLRQEITSNVTYCVLKLASVLEFGFKCGSPAHDTGISIPLISVSIAGLMAIFIDPNLAFAISESAVTVAIRQACSALLDHRLSATSSSVGIGLEPNTCKKMVKAINKLAIQATHGVKRDVAYQSLMSLQLQFCILEKYSSISDPKNADNRMSRIIMKLFNRVLKAEGNEMNPFSRSDFDLESVLESLENILSKSYCRTEFDTVDKDKMEPCRSMGTSFMMELSRVKHSRNSIFDLKDALLRYGYSNETFVGRLFVSCCTKLGYESILKSQNTSSSPKASPAYDADRLSELIFAVGDAEGEIRARAIEDLKSFVDNNPGITLDAHLSGLSEPFRKYILDQLKSKSPMGRHSSRGSLSGFSFGLSSESEPSLKPMNTERNGSTNMTMSEKLQYLKSKINAAEETAQSVIHQEPPQPPTTALSPTSFSTLKQRLAAASEKRLTSPTNLGGDDTPFESAAMGNAAILRARLESVKRMNGL